MVFIPVHGTQLAYDEAGSGPAVIFVHAGIADRRMWEQQFTALAAGHRVVRYDWRGHGESADATGAAAHHDDLIGLMDALDINRAALVGCSYGGAYAVDAALSAPHRVTSLTLICSGLSGHVWPPEMQKLAEEHVYGAVPAERLRQYADGTAEHVDPDDVEAMARAQASLMVAGPDRSPDALSPEVWELAVDMCRVVFRRMWSRGSALVPQWTEPPAVGRLGDVAAATLVVNGLADIPPVQEVSGLLASGIPGARRVDLPDTGHLPPVERPAETTRLIADHLAQQG
ncbi:alpha/beta fold hydrolase [Phytoactinopolyspora limicola]|uniref:alpha/beta fold hydrolase n=1 Tax=Phytoactinopolyspora limicola TaxID=2715536 RepID=UPI00140B13F7|nr:alpha/beta fold hydrolase [Phytoactinopolyspora limicola]